MSESEAERSELHRHPLHLPLGNEPYHPAALPPGLLEYLQDRDITCVTQATDRGIALVIKAPLREIRSAQGPVPIAVRHELYDHATAPVIRMLTTIYDQPARPFALETFIN